MEKSEEIDINSSDRDMNQLTCCLKNAIFSKYISNYLVEKTEEMWILYEKRIDKFLKDKHIDIICNHTRPQTAIKLEEFAKDQQENIRLCKHDIEILCSSRKRFRNDNKYPIEYQSTQHPATSSSSMGVPKTPRCIDRLEFNLASIKPKFI